MRRDRQKKRLVVAALFFQGLTWTQAAKAILRFFYVRDTTGQRLSLILYIYALTVPFLLLFSFAENKHSFATWLSYQVVFHGLALAGQRSPASCGYQIGINRYSTDIYFYVFCVLRSALYLYIISTNSNSYISVK